MFEWPSSLISKIQILDFFASLNWRIFSLSAILLSVPDSKKHVEP